MLTAPAGEIAAALSVPIDIGKSFVQTCRNLEAAEQVLSRAEKAGARFVTFWDESYPKRLKNIPDPPVALYMLGEQSPLYDYSVAIVGTRVPSEHAKGVAQRISREMAAAGVTVVSGMALGIDSIAHDAALKAGGRTIAVLGCGIDVIYPPSNKSLFRRIAQQGAVMSEYPPGTKPEQHNFPRRNRIISGLSLGVVIVEAGIKSGALITARLALEQGRELFSIPGPAGMPRSAGVNSLIRDNIAHLVERGEEIIEHLRSQLAPVLNVSAAMTLPDMNKTEKAVYDLLENGSLQIDEIIRSTGLSAVVINQVLTAMTLKGLIRQMRGARVERA